MAKTKRIEITEEIDCKRFYIPQQSTKTKCPKCQSEQNVYTADYLSYPKIGNIDAFGWECNNCGTELSVPFTIKKITITIEINEQDK